jgi:hypothetical protein
MEKSDVQSSARMEQARLKAEIVRLTSVAADAESSAKVSDEKYTKRAVCQQAGC